MSLMETQKKKSDHFIIKWNKTRFVIISGKTSSSNNDDHKATKDNNVLRANDPPLNDENRSLGSTCSGKSITNLKRLDEANVEKKITLITEEKKEPTICFTKKCVEDNMKFESSKRKMLDAYKNIKASRKKNQNDRHQ